MVFDLERWTAEFTEARTAWRTLTDYPGSYDPRRADALQQRWIALAKEVLLVFARACVTSPLESSYLALLDAQRAAQIMLERQILELMASEKLKGVDP